MPTEQAPQRRARILVCDDSPTISHYVALILGPTHEFLLVSSAEEALAKAASFGPDLVITDLIMPGIDGYELCRKLRAQPQLQSVPIILLTGETSDDSKAMGLEVGADDYLFKPIRRRELLARVKSSLRLREVMVQLTARTAELESTNTQLKKTMDELVRSEKLAALGQLVAGIAHELNNPINFISGNLRMLEDYSRTLVGLFEKLDNLLPAEARAAAEGFKREADFDFLRKDLTELLGSVNRGTLRAAEIVRGLRAFARQSSGVTTAASLEEIARECVTLVSHEIKNRILVSWKVAPTRQVVCEVGRMEQVFINLLMNALQAIPETGEICIEVGERESRVYCAIHDTGIGMTPEVRSKIFDPFFTTKPTGQGTGLGLSISYGIIQQAGGKIEVDSTPGKGSTFTVYLPAQP